MNKGNRMRIALALAASSMLILTSAIAFAQGGQGRGQRGQGGFGQGRGGFGGGMMQFGGGGKLGLVQRNDVLTDIQATAQQKEQLASLQGEMQEEMRAMFQGGGGGRGSGGGGGFDRGAIEELMKEANSKVDAKIKTILNEQQFSRLNEIELQLQGGRVLFDRDFQKKLEITIQQRRQIEDLQVAQQEANQQVMMRMRNGEIGREDIQAIMEKNNKILDEELLKVLTADQTAKLNAMKGKPFKADPNIGRGGGA